MSVVIKIENVSKKYQLGLIGTKTLKGDIQRWWYRMKGLPDPTLMVGQENNLSSVNSLPEEFVWALKDINFEVCQGEVLGIIGKNGAGKSTLLKLLSRVTAPTNGNIKVKGRIASLLEVGTGFHPELTGRENIYLNGAILGMTKVEISSKFDEIVSFAGIEKYIDTPVKRYSSGMYVRLAFAVAAHLEPEILIVDEVLAVGDAEFQKRAVGKMQDVSQKDGRTVLFVSHNMAAIEKLCNRCLLLENGSLILNGSTQECIDKYLSYNYEFSEINLSNRIDRRGSQKIVFQDIIILNDSNERIESISSGKKVKFRTYFKKYSEVTLDKCRISLAIIREERPYIVLSSELIIYENITIRKSGYIDFIIEKCPLSKGNYFLTLFFESNGIILDWIDNAIQIHVEDGDYYGTGKSYPVGWDGKTVLVNHSIEVKEDDK
jgi:lipopolysaccharide transport system ATP-binding protein